MIIAGLIDELQAFLNEAENCANGRKGMQVPYTGIFAGHVTHPSTVRDVRRIVRQLEEAACQRVSPPSSTTSA
jgi:hypothetical protein